jgi:hypothetical protein
MAILGVTTVLQPLTGEKLMIESHVFTYGLLLAFIVLITTIWFLIRKEKKRKALDPNYRPVDLWVLFIRALPCIFYWAAFYGPAFGVPVFTRGSGRTFVVQLIVGLTFLWLGRVLALLQQLVDKTPNQQGNSV